MSHLPDAWIRIQDGQEQKLEVDQLRSRLSKRLWLPFTSGAICITDVVQDNHITIKNKLVSQFEQL